ncbi:MAG: carbohydrate kinase family protein [Thermoguttaceae bacterium]
MKQDYSSRCISTGILFADVACMPIDHVPQAGELVETERIELSLGGNAANVAINLSKLEVPVGLAGCVGDDPLSDFILHAVDVPHVDTSLVQRTNNSCPGTAMHINVAREDRRFVCTTGANDKFVFSDELRHIIHSPNIESPKVFFLGGLLMLASLENDESVSLFAEAHRAGWTTILDVVLYGKRPVWPVVASYLPVTDIFLPNDHEAQILTGFDTPDAQADVFLNAGCKRVVITQGERGTLYKSRDHRFEMPIFPVEFVSGAGSGDAFAAGLIAAILDGHDDTEAVRWGAAQGASAVRGVSTTEKTFTRKELEEFLKQRD